MYQLVDFKTREPVESSNLVFTGEDGPWEVVMDLDSIRSKVNIDYFKKSPPLASKYLPLMPIKDYRDFVTLGEGNTPLIRSSVLGEELGVELYFKLCARSSDCPKPSRNSRVQS